MLSVSALKVEVDDKVIVDGVSFTIRAREKVGIVGRNGAGKTTMLKVLGGGDPPAAGTVGVKGDLGYLSQDPRTDGVPDDIRAVDHILSGRGFDEAAARLEKLRLRMEEDPSDANIGRYTRAQERYEIDGGYAADGEVRRLAAGLGLGDDRLELPIGALSGGERRRIELARILFAGSDVLLLDEPTNHLDIDARDWLMGFLRSYRGALIVISHDLDLLDDAITRIIHLDREAERAVGTIYEYKGTYTEYLSARAKDEERLAKLATRQQAEINRLESLADSMRHSTAKRARQAKSLDTRVERLRSDAVDAPKGKRDLALRFPEPPHAGKLVLEAEKMSKSYGDLLVFDDVALTLGRGERLLIMGLNGAGKTSLLRILAGVIEPDTAELRWGTGVDVGYYAQEHEGLVGHETLLENMRNHTLGVDDERLRSLMGMFGLSGDKAHQDAGTLSGGEKTKLALAQLVAGRHNVLLLDEPTNNLDPPSRTATAEALSAWPGTMVIVSHDPEFVRELEPDKVLEMPEGQLDYWSEDLVELVALS
ncbi:MAG: ABC-F family ATP-binding cassette domain-containing protein [Actinomycetota bacterium]|nr:ABC-F family ATP-binding cassette domain-containing protein [Actinomycetota bacterium]